MHIKKDLLWQVRKFIRFKKAISGGKKDLTGEEDDVFQEVSRKLAEGQSIEHALENGFNAHYRFIKSRGAIFLPEFFHEQVKEKYMPLVKMAAKDLRFISYKNFWRSFSDHPHSVETICLILEEHFVKFEVVPSQHEKYKVSINVDVECPICGNSCYQICLNSKGWYFGKCRTTGETVKPANIGKALAVALSKPYPGIKEYIYEYLQNYHRLPH